MKKRLFIFTRDIALFFLLLLLMRTAFKRAYHFLLAHEQSMIHELDRSFLEYLYTTQKQIFQTKSLLEDLNNNALIQKIAFLQQRLATIEEKYKKNSPGIMFLGPIATTSIVLKEKQLENKLLSIIQELGQILHSLNSIEKKYVTSESINQGLAANTSYLKQLS